MIIKHTTVLFICFVLLAFFGADTVFAQYTDDVSINAVVSVCEIEITAKPEKRIPTVNNWSTQLYVDVYDASDNQLVMSYTDMSNAQGVAHTDVCALGFAPLPGTYNFSIRGFSHLIKDFSGITTFSDRPVTFIDFVGATNTRLLAGEVSGSFNNAINGLDLSAVVARLYSTDLKTDLNRDGRVNALDLSNLIFNLYRSGD